ncbi:MAG TPA: MaoC family dehydratase N-terminal domain-containing protein [Gemmatimonadaceae bacterium]|jgi:3-methylfumaryl-CoA hydratase|nr:MaoC family dehydratase N-terminal domain-containing protein [Gemmatimonadaceae bacterium]
MPHPELAAWLGRREVSTDRIVASRVAAWHATLDHTVEIPGDGDDVPPAIYWTLFPPLTPTSGLGEDGHARRGGFLPPVELPRRMWAGSRLTCHAPLRVGSVVTRESSIARIDEKEGRAGPLVFVTVHHVVRVGDDIVLEEEQDLVYRNPSRPSAAASGSRVTPEVPRAAWERSINANEVLLFRYSALTFNGHRIHYDRSYADCEGYPGLVVHGPLIATLLLDLLHSRRGAATVERFHFKAMRPSFDGQPLSLCGAPRDDRSLVDLWSLTADGDVGVEATAWIR